MDNHKQTKTHMKKTIMIFAIAAVVSACGGASTKGTVDTVVVAVDTVAVDTAAVAPVEGGAGVSQDGTVPTEKIK